MMWEAEERGGAFFLGSVENRPRYYYSNQLYIIFT